MQTGLSRLIDLGVMQNQPRSEQRRIRTINAVSIVAFVATAAFAALFAFARPQELGWIGYLGLLAAYLTAYAVVPWLNGRRRHDAAATLLLLTGLVNVVVVNLTVGFGTGTAVFLVAVAIGAVVTTGGRRAILRWSIVVLAVGAFTWLVVLDPPVAPTVDGTWVEDLLVVASFGGVVAFVVTVVWYQRRLTDTAEEELLEANARSEALLRNILPAEIAERLQAGEYPIADAKPEVTVLFADIVDSTRITAGVSVTDLVVALDSLFSAFDEIVEAHGLEKIKTVGDNYFAVAGLAPGDHGHAQSAADAALRMREHLRHHTFPGMGETQMRFGLHTGPVMAGVIGKRKFSYDLWGDTVNTASRMESTSEPGMIQVSQPVHDRLKRRYDMEPRGRVRVKGKGEMSTYSLRGRKTDRRLRAPENRVLE